VEVDEIELEELEINAGLAGDGEIGSDLKEAHKDRLGLSLSLSLSLC
jgi:hypothetical protein